MIFGPGELGELIDAMLAEAAAGCCGDAAWRGRLCQYHGGYEAGLEAMATRLGAA